MNKASTARGMEGNGVRVGVGGTSGVAVRIKGVGLFSGVFTGVGGWVNSGDASGVGVLSGGIDGRLFPGSRLKIKSKNPAAMKTPRLE